MLHSFHFLLAVWALRGATEATLEQIVPSEGAFVTEKPQKGGHFRPISRSPDKFPKLVFRMLDRVHNSIGLLRGEHSFGSVPPP